VSLCAQLLSCKHPCEACSHLVKLMIRTSSQPRNTRHSADYTAHRSTCRLQKHAQPKASLQLDLAKRTRHLPQQIPKAPTSVKVLTLDTSRYYPCGDQTAHLALKSSFCQGRPHPPLRVIHLRLAKFLSGLSLQNHKAHKAAKASMG